MSIANEFLGNAMDLLGKYARGNGTLIAAIQKAIADLGPCRGDSIVDGVIADLRRAIAENEGPVDA